MRKAFIAAVVALVLSACATDPDSDTICFDDWLYVEDVYGTGRYPEYREEFEKENGCSSAINCSTAKLKIRRCLENVEFK